MTYYLWKGSFGRRWVQVRKGDPLAVRVTTDCGREILLKLAPKRVHCDSDGCKYFTGMFHRKSYLHGVDESEFYCVRCNKIYDRSFARQAGISGGNKCKGCYNNGRVEERNRNIQAQLRNRLHTCLSMYLLTTRELNKTDLARESFSKLGSKPTAQVLLDGSLSKKLTWKNHIDYVWLTHRVKIVGRDCNNANRRKSQSDSKTRKMIGCSAPDLRKWIEGQFETGWSWDNRGSLWELDHIVPYVKFDLTNDKHVLKVMNYTNIRPLSVSANRSKGGSH
jgi:hypothetical protein